METGEVLDYHVLSKECSKCTLKKAQCQSDEEFQEWQIQHLASNECGTLLVTGTGGTSTYNT